MSGEPITALDQLEAELLRDARPALEPDQAHVESLWRSVAAASALGAAFSGVSTSFPPASGTAWAPPKPDSFSPPAPTPAPTTLVEQSGLLQRLGQASFGVRALAFAALGGALVGFAAGYGSAGVSQKRFDPPGAANPASSDSSSASNASPAAPIAEATPGVAVDSLPAHERQSPPTPRDTSVKPRPGAVLGSSEPTAEPPKASFYEELSYLKRAQAALRQGNGALALGLMSELDSIQPGGALLSERGVTQVLAHCQLGDVQAAERVAARLAAGDLASVYAERLETSCAGAVLSKP